jgi:hypothetical protein
MSAADTANGEFQGLLKFDLAPAKAAFDALYGAGRWKPDGSTLRLTTSNPNNPLFNANAAGRVSVIWMKNDAWVEGTGGPITPTTDGITWNTLPSFISTGEDGPLGELDFPGGTSGTRTYVLGSNPGFVEDVLSGGTLSLRLFASPGDTNTSYLFSSRSFSNVASRPALTLFAAPVPEPTGCVALAGIAGKLLRRRRRHS